jgi:hypothetical protein
MTQAQGPKSATTAIPFRSRPQPKSETPTTLWQTLEEGLQTQLTKHLAELIRRVRQSPTPRKGKDNELG